jgi:protein gp37
VLTKRGDRIEELSSNLQWQPNIWLGVSVESEKYAYRIDHLRKTKAHVKFLSIEPLLGPVGKLNLRGIDWVIVGGESGPGARDMNAKWVADIRDQCIRAGIAFFFKQWGGVQKKRHGRELEGRTWDEMPELAVIS